MKKQSICIFLISSLLLTFIACREDTSTDSAYVESFDLHLTYSIFGEREPFSYPLSLTLSNTTEQITYTRESDLWGKVTLSDLLPGEYTISITGRLTAEEVAEVTGNPASEGTGLVGFVSNVKLKLKGENDLGEIALVMPTSSSIIFKELYYAGSRTSTQGSYRNDGFFSIYNNSSSPALLNDIYIGNIENYGGIGVTGPLWPGEEQGNYKHVYVQVAWKIISGEAPVMLSPGQQAVIATMAAPHNKEEQYNQNSPVDLSSADYEAYSTDPKNTYPDFKAANMTRAFWPGYRDLWRLGVFGQGMVLIKASKQEFDSFETVALPESFQDPFEDEEYWLCKKIPLSYIIDAVDLIQNSAVTNTKRFPPALDSGFATTGGTYLGKSVIRKVVSYSEGNVVYQDTNNSTEDFEVNDRPLSK